MPIHMFPKGALFFRMGTFDEFGTFSDRNGRYHWITVNLIIWSDENHIDQQSTWYPRRCIFPIQKRKFVM